MLELDFIAAQERREREQDAQAEEWGLATLELAELVRVWGKAAIAAELATYPDTTPEPLPTHQLQCSHCVNWRSPRPLTLADGTTHVSPGFCELRAASDCEQMPQHYAAQCYFYEPDVPF